MEDINSSLTISDSGCGGSSLGSAVVSHAQLYRFDPPSEQYASYAATCLGNLAGRAVAGLTLTYDLRKLSLSFSSVVKIPLFSYIISDL